MKLNPYNLTPLHEGWGWGLRTVEILGQTLSLILVKPVLLVHQATGWALSKVLS